MEFAFKFTDSKTWPYELVQDYSYQLPGTWPKLTTPIVTEYVILTATNLLVMKKGYRWNGADAAPDVTRILRGSLVHDAICQLIGLGKLTMKPYRLLGDQALYQCCREDSMTWPVANVVYYSVRAYAKFLKPIWK